MGVNSSADKLFRVFVDAAIDGLHRVHRQQIIHVEVAAFAMTRRFALDENSLLVQPIREPENNFIDLAGAEILPATDIFRAPLFLGRHQPDPWPLHCQTGSLYYNPDRRSNNYRLEL